MICAPLSEQGADPVELVVEPAKRRKVASQDVGGRLINVSEASTREKSTAPGPGFGSPVGVLNSTRARFMIWITSFAITPYAMVVGCIPPSENSPPSVRPAGPEAKNLVFGTGSRLSSSGGSG